MGASIPIAELIKLKTMKIYRYFSPCILGILILSLSNCVYYKSIPIDEPTAMNIESLSKTKRTVLLSNNFSSATYRIDGLKVNDSTFSGDVTFTTGLHDPGQKSFKEKKQDEQLTQIDPLNTMHIHLNTTTQIKAGHFEAPITSIESVNMHKKDPAKSAAIILIPLAAIVLISVIAASAMTISLGL